MFIEQEISVDGSNGVPNITLAPVKVEDLCDLPFPPHADVTKFLAPYLVELVEGLCAGDEDTFDQLSSDRETAFWVYTQTKIY